ncbi:MAG: CHAT domain-containing protein [Alphaproteobacteria bacterium]|nr:CHAT domain-containing protein [Alphaproteobacteria bacterium]
MDVLWLRVEEQEGRLAVILEVGGADPRRFVLPWSPQDLLRSTQPLRDVLSLRALREAVAGWLEDHPDGVVAVDSPFPEAPWEAPLQGEPSPWRVVRAARSRWAHEPPPQGTPLRLLEVGAPLEDATLDLSAWGDRVRVRREPSLTLSGQHELVHVWGARARYGGLSFGGRPWDETALLSWLRKAGTRVLSLQVAEVDAQWACVHARRLVEQGAPPIGIGVGDAPASTRLLNGWLGLLLRLGDPVEARARLGAIAAPSWARRLALVTAAPGRRALAPLRAPGLPETIYRYASFYQEPDRFGPDMFLSIDVPRLEPLRPLWEEPRERPRSRQLNAHLCADAEGARLPNAPLAPARPVWLELSVGLPDASGLLDRPLPQPTVDRLRDEGGGTLALQVFADGFAFTEEDGARAPVPGAWLRVERCLDVDAEGNSPPIRLGLQPERLGRCSVRVAVYHHDRLVQTARVDARVATWGSLKELRLPPAQTATLWDMGVSGLVALADRSPEPVARRLGITPSDAGALIQRARALLALTARGRVEYSAEPEADDAPEAPAVSLFTNDLFDQPVVGLKVAGLAPMSYDLPREACQELAARTRAVLLEVAMDPEARQYRFQSVETSTRPMNTGSRKNLLRGLAALAGLGRDLYTRLFPSADQRSALALALETPQLVEVARLSHGTTLPWNLVYDYELDPDVARLPPERAAEHVCLHALEQSEPVACRARADCPLASDETWDTTICPWGFWGLRHRLQEPAQRVGVDGQPRPVATRVRADAGAEAVIGVSVELDRVTDHAARVDQQLQAHGLPAEVRGAKPAEGRDAVLAALKSRDLAFIYFYCHGGTEASALDEQAWLEVGPGGPDNRILAEHLGRLGRDRRPLYAWPRHPVVMLNGCRTAELDPRVLVKLVDSFADRHAAAVIGTLVEVWEPLAIEVAEGVLERLLDGEALGDALLAVRRALLAKGNPLGLVYVNHGVAELRLER